MNPPVKAPTTSVPKRVVATLHTSASTLPPARPSERRIERLRELTRRDPTWKQDD